MTLLIDGYNVLFAKGLLGGKQAENLRQARQKLLQFLSEHLNEEQLRHTVVVFDAKRAPRAADETIECGGLHVLFARGHAEADDLIEQLIRREPNPGRLLVVTSDQRLRLAASRRRARWIKSEDWLYQLEHHQAERQPDQPVSPGADPNPSHAPTRLDEREVADWLNTFGLLVETHAESQNDEEAEETSWGPFPPGYGDDLPDALEH